ncbi:GNAT family N-acetyltransferase [Pseudomonas sp. RA_35y_Pfl2_P32]|uniref:GNAT family N-acetyltransferase n=1 Tax=Pseudomonas sp. RA_35y_Pfl2_P32 TaxID=3088705 RepID=UPI0030DD5E29
MAPAYCLLLRRDLAGPLPPSTWPAGIRLDTYQPALAEAVHQLLEAGYRQGGGQVSTLAIWRERFERDPEYDPHLCVIATDAQGLVGVIQCWTSAYIKHLVVHPRAQGQGLGRALLLHAFSLFQQRREGFVDLKVLEDNLRARQLYERCGMRLIRREPVPD